MAIQNAKNEQIVRGDNLWLFVSPSFTGTGDQKEAAAAVPVAFATNCSLNRSTAMNSISSKYHGPSNYSTPGEGTWTASTEALYAIVGTGSDDRTGDAGFAQLMTCMDENKPVNVQFGYVANAGTNIVDESGSFDWTISNGWEGKAYINSLQATGNHGDAATWSLELTGNGKLKAISTTPATPSNPS